jgi:hypothetical protein
MIPQPLDTCSLKSPVIDLILIFPFPDQFSSPLGLTVANYQACIQLIEFLNARLKKNNHNVKYKCLVIIKVSLSDERSFLSFLIIEYLPLASLQDWKSRF